MEELMTCEANYVPLTPITFLERAAAVYSERKALVYGRRAFTWDETHARARSLASALRAILGVAKNDVVSVLAPNVPAVYEMHFAVPMAGAVLNTINTRLDSAAVATILRHSMARVLFVDYELIPLAKEALKKMAMECSSKLPVIVTIDDVDAPTRIRFGELEYEELIAGGDPMHEPVPVVDENDSIALNYTSGTTAAPKGVVYSHRGAYLSTMSLLLQWEVGSEPVYLWSLPMFHCNGWTFTWGMAARGGTNVCIRSPTAAHMYKAIADHGVTHMCGVPLLFKLLLDATHDERRLLRRPVHMLTGGAPPPPALLERIESIGFRITHAYGMTEATGPALLCEWRSEWDVLPAAERAGYKARQGVSMLTLAGSDVKCPETMASVPRDGKTVGEIVLKGSSLMKGYYKDPGATSKAFNGGWLWTGDVGVVHHDGYVEIKDRSKDVIISGGENISSVEVETVMYAHPAVSEAAVVAMPDPHWGESPCAFVVLRQECAGEAKEGEMVEFCRRSMPRYMAPRRVVFLKDLPKTSTGKPLKTQLREWAKELAGGSSSSSPAPKGQKSSGRRPLESSGEFEVVAKSRL